MRSKVHNHDDLENHKCEEHKSDHSHHEPERRNINVDAAYLHVLGDMIMSVGVVIAAIIIYLRPDWKIADPICTYIFSIIVCFTVKPIIKSCIQVLMEGSPQEINI